MSDSRDTNHDGHVSITEKIKDKLHLHRKKNKNKKGTRTSDSTGHSGLPVAQPVNHAASLNQNLPVSSAATSATLATNSGIKSETTSHSLNHGLPVSTHANTETLAANSGFASHGLNQDHVSTSTNTEAFAQTGHSGLPVNHTASHQDHISTAVNTGTVAVNSGFESEEARLRLYEEQLAVSKRAVSAGAVDLVKRVQEEQVERSIPVIRQEVVMERRPYSGDDSSRVPEKDEIARVILYREEVVTEKRIVPIEEVIVHKDMVTDQHTVGAVLRSEYVETSQAAATASSAYGYVGDVDKKFKSDDNLHMKAARG